MTTYTPPELKPLSIGQIFDRSIRLYRNNFLTFVGVIAITQLPTLILGLVSAYLTGQIFEDVSLGTAGSTNFVNQSIGLGVLSFIIGIVGFVLTQIARAAITRAVADKYLGKDISVMEAYGRIKKEWLTLILALIISVLFSLLLLIWTMIPCIGWVTGIGMVYFFSTVIIPLLAPIVVLENHSATNSIYRAWDLSRRQVGWLIGFTLLLSLLGFAISAGPNYLIQLSLTSIFGLASNTTMVLTIQQVSTTILNILYLPIPLICFTLLYIDLRVKTEGFDLSLMAAEDPETETDIDEVLSANTALGNPKPTSDEMGQFFVITIVIAALYGILIMMARLFTSTFSPF